MQENSYFVQVLFKLKLSGHAELAELDYILSSLGLDQNQFLSMCIIAGCDFLPNIKGIGIKKASQMVHFTEFLERLKNHKFAPSNYCDQFRQATAVFQHQIIYDTDGQITQPLYAWQLLEDENKTQFCQACGEYPFKLAFILGGGWWGGGYSRDCILC